MTGAGGDGSSKIMLISIHPEHVQRIVEGTKTIELRRRVPNVRPGDQVVIYSTAPVGAITARCTVKAVESLPPSVLWRRYSSTVGVTRERFDDYFAGKASATALHLSDVHPLRRAVPLGELRRSGPFQPPQSWRFLTPTAAASLFGDLETGSATPSLRADRRRNLAAWQIAEQLPALLRRASATVLSNALAHLDEIQPPEAESHG